jgi:hypothetical protein
MFIIHQHKHDMQMVHLKGAFTLDVKDSSIKSPNTKLIV